MLDFFLSIQNRSAHNHYHSTETRRMASSAEELIWNTSGLHPPGSRNLLQAQNGDAVYFVDYKPPARDTLTLPRNVLYVLAGVLLVVVATYAIVGHLINDLMHNLADWVLAPKTEVEDAERGPGEGEYDDDDDDSDDDTNEEGRRMSAEMQTIAEVAGLLPGLQRCSSFSYPCNQHGSRASLSTQQRGSCPSTNEISIRVPYVTSL
ncbi:hypothetical protein SRHO_G00238630 [Serrasalmus rhombeus]